MNIHCDQSIKNLNPIYTMCSEQQVEYAIKLIEEINSYEEMVTLFNSDNVDPERLKSLQQQLNQSHAMVSDDILETARKDMRKKLEIANNPVISASTQINETLANLQITAEKADTAAGINFNDPNSRSSEIDNLNSLVSRMRTGLFNNFAQVSDAILNNPLQAINSSLENISSVSAKATQALRAILGMPEDLSPNATEAEKQASVAELRANASRISTQLSSYADAHEAKAENAKRLKKENDDALVRAITDEIEDGKPIVVKFKYLSTANTETATPTRGKSYTERTVDVKFKNFNALLDFHGKLKNSTKVEIIKEAIRNDKSLKSAEYVAQYSFVPVSDQLNNLITEEAKAVNSVVKELEKLRSFVGNNFLEDEQVVKFKKVVSELNKGEVATLDNFGVEIQNNALMNPADFVSLFLFNTNTKITFPNIIYTINKVLRYPKTQIAQILNNAFRAISLNDKYKIVLKKAEVQPLITLAQIAYTKEQITEKLPEALLNLFGEAYKQGDKEIRQAIEDITKNYVEQLNSHLNNKAFKNLERLNVSQYILPMSFANTYQLLKEIEADIDPVFKKQMQAFTHLSNMQKVLLDKANSMSTQQVFINHLCIQLVQAMAKTGRTRPIDFFTNFYNEDSIKKAVQIIDEKLALLKKEKELEQQAFKKALIQELPEENIDEDDEDTYDEDAAEARAKADELGLTADIALLALEGKKEKEINKELKNNEYLSGLKNTKSLGFISDVLTSLGYPGTKDEEIFGEWKADINKAIKNANKVLAKRGITSDSKTETKPKTAEKVVENKPKEEEAKPEPKVTTETGDDFEDLFDMPENPSVKKDAPVPDSSEITAEIDDPFGALADIDLYFNNTENPLSEATLEGIENTQGEAEYTAEKQATDPINENVQNIFGPTDNAESNFEVDLDNNDIKAPVIKSARHFIYRNKKKYPTDSLDFLFFPTNNDNNFEDIKRIQEEAILNAPAKFDNNLNTFNLLHKSSKKRKKQSAKILNAEVNHCQVIINFFEQKFVKILLNFSTVTILHLITRLQQENTRRKKAGLAIRYPYWSLQTRLKDYMLDNLQIENLKQGLDAVFVNQIEKMAVINELYDFYCHAIKTNNYWGEIGQNTFEHENWFEAILAEAGEQGIPLNQLLLLMRPFLEQTAEQIQLDQLCQSHFSSDCRVYLVTPLFPEMEGYPVEKNQPIWYTYHHLNYQKKPIGEKFFVLNQSFKSAAISSQLFLTQCHIHLLGSLSKKPKNGI